MHICRSYRKSAATLSQRFQVNNVSTLRLLRAATTDLDTCTLSLEISAWKWRVQRTPFRSCITKIDDRSTPILPNRRIQHTWSAVQYCIEGSDDRVTWTPFRSSAPSNFEVAQLREQIREVSRDKYIYRCLTGIYAIPMQSDSNVFPRHMIELL